MNNHYLILPLILLVGCTIPISDEVSDKKVTEWPFEKIYSVMEYKNLYKGFCGTNVSKVNARVIEKRICSCPEDPDASCDCFIFGGGTFSLGDENGIVQHYKEDNVDENVWNNVEKGGEYLFTISRGIITLAEKSNEKFPTIREYVQEFRKVCKEKSFMVRGKVIENKVCLPPVLEGVIFRCNEEDKLVIEDNDETIEFINLDKELLKKIKEGQEYIFTLQNMRVVSAELV